ncbi:M48 family metallopeptidase [Roseicyclus mahoneyensis]|uniref:Peptidase M48-like protein n=1 Tax=Roseicyclus mahoneyensis TaxID=164332 RepID=A0A316GEZ0_9RHOB|nr:M48 family metallopeptidase [Roseicyclus mahoneyensis]PWK59460.1 peptidase M48-like protein [Roseicyclus mahoneyensis]
MRLTVIALCAAALLSGCVQVVPLPQASPPPVDMAARARQAVANFDEVVTRVEPVAEQVCREQTPDQICDFIIYVDRSPQSGVNAFHTLDPQGRPAIIFTLGLIAVAQNTDELAFIMGHEAAHHIARHLPTGRLQAEQGARVFADIARARGASAAEIGEAAQIGSFVAFRQFGQQAELEADAIGTLIAARAGYDPLIGSAFFTRIPDPAQEFLSSHPPNAARIETVRSTLRAMGRPGV